MILLERPCHALDTELLESLGLFFPANDDGDVESVARGVCEELGKNSAADVSCESVSGQYTLFAAWGTVDVPVAPMSKMGVARDMLDRR